MEVAGYACSRCLRRQRDGETCEVCQGELFDLRSRQQRAFIEDAEQRVRDARDRRIHVIAALSSLLIGVPIAAVIVFFAPLLFVGRHVTGNALLTVVAIAGAVVIGPGVIVEKTFERRRTSLLDGVPDADRP